MITHEQPAREPLAYIWYRRLINLYPGAFRSRYAAEMLQVFAEDWSRVSSRTPTYRWRYWIHTLCDLAKTIPREWLAAMPLVPKLSLFGIGLLVLRNVIDGRWLTISFWLFYCAFMVASFAVSLRRSRLGRASSVLLVGVFGLTGLWLEKLLAGFGHNLEKDAIGTMGAALIMMTITCDLAVSTPVKTPAASLKVAWHRFINHAHFNRHLLAALCTVYFVSVAGSLLFEGEDLSGGFLLFCICQMLLLRLSRIWENPNQISSPDPKIRSA